MAIEVRYRQLQKPNHGSSTGEWVDVKEVFNDTTGEWIEVGQMKRDLKKAEAIFKEQINNYETILKGIQIAIVLTEDL